MTRRRFIADEVDGSSAAILGEHAHHLVRVLRVEVGQQYDLVAGGIATSARVTAVAAGRVDFALLDQLPASAPAMSLNFFLAIYKFDRFEWALEKLTELGVCAVTPVITRRTDLHLAKAAGNRLERWRKIVREVAQQSRRDRELHVAEPVKLKQILDAPGRRAVLSEVDPKQGVLRTLPEFLSLDPADTVALAVGPEGGWTDDELDLMLANAWQPVTLGPTILRAETAAIAAAAIALSHQ